MDSSLCPPRFSPTQRAVLLLALIPVLAAAGFAGQANASELPTVRAPLGVERFLAPGGAFDLEAAQRAQFEGPLDMAGFEARFDPSEGRVHFSAQGRSGRQDHHWVEGFNLPGANFNVMCVAVYEGELVIGGTFTVAGHVRVEKIAKWNGETWSALGGGVIGGGCFTGVYALAVYDGRLIVAGDFSKAGHTAARNIAAWDGESWEALGTGLSGGGDGVAALAVVGGELFAGGDFRDAGGAAVSNIAQWNGASWSDVGGGTNDRVECLAAYDDALIVGGRFDQAGGVTGSCIARWGGEEWSGLGDGLPSGGCGIGVKVMTIHEGDLIVGGRFSTSQPEQIVNIARWDGIAWSAVGDVFPNNTVRGLASWNGDLYATGDFTLIGGGSHWEPYSCIARWDGEAWNDIGGLWGKYAEQGFCLGVHDGRLIVGGDFEHAGETPAYYVAQWDGEGWSAVSPGSGMDHKIDALATYEGGLVAGGRFYQAGGTPARAIAQWDGGTWHALGGGMGGVEWPSVVTLAVHEGDLYVGGSFAEAGEIAASYVARWDGAAWHSLGAGVNAPVLALGSHDGDLYVGGDFTEAGGNPAGHIARWDGIAWYPLDSGVNGSVTALTDFQGNLAVGGRLTEAGGVSARGVASWNGHSWSALGSGTNAPVLALTVFDGDLVAGGSFLRAGDQTVNCIARWDGQSWWALGSGMSGYPTGTETLALTVYQESLIAAGNFLAAGGVTAYHIARWDGEVWSSLGTGLHQEAYALASAGDDLYVGGNFLFSNGEAGTHNGIPSERIALWRESPSDVPDVIPDSDPRVAGLTVRLDPVRPNPVWSRASIDYHLPVRGFVQATVHDPGGRCVATLFSGFRNAGRHSLVWDVSGGNAIRFPAGIYFLRLDLEGRVGSERFMVVQ